MINKIVKYKKINYNIMIHHDFKLFTDFPINSCIVANHVRILTLLSIPIEYRFLLIKI